MRLLRAFREFQRQRRGATAVEYGVLIACIALIAVAVLEGIGSALGKIYQTIAGYMM